MKDLYKQANQMKKDLAQQSAIGSGAYNNIKITINGSQEITNVEINQEFLNSNKEDLEKGIKDATNDAIKKSQALMAEQMKQSGMSIPGM